MAEQVVVTSEVTELVVSENVVSEIHVEETPVQISVEPTDGEEITLQVVEDEETTVLTVPGNETILSDALETEIQLITEYQQGPPGPPGEQGIQGIQGPQGVRGERGPAFFVFQEELLTVDESFSGIYTLNETPYPNSFRLFVNGLKLLPDEFELDGTTVTVNAEIVQGDIINFEYYHES